MAFEDWAATVFLLTPREEQVARAAWNAAVERAAAFMLSRKVSASEFYSSELLKMKSVHTDCHSETPK